MRIGRTVVLAVSLVGVVTVGTPAGAEPVACQRAIVRAASKLAQVEVGALTKCGAARLRGDLPFATDCRVEPGTAATLADARADLGLAIAKACGGDDRACDATDTGSDADDPLASIGWDLGTCPNLGDGPCTGALAACDDVATCVGCIAETAVKETLDLVHAGFAPALPGTAPSKCQLAIGKATSQYVAARTKTLAKCEDGALRGVIAGPCPDAKAAATIAKAEAKKVATICKACGGADRACGGGDDLDADVIGFSPSCPVVTVPGGAACGGAVADLAGIVDCVDCFADYGTSCVDAASVPGLRAYPDACGLVATPTPTPTATRTPTPTPTVTPPAGAASVKCQRVLVKEGAAYAQARLGALAKCEASKAKGKLPPETECTAEPKTAARLAKADARLRAQIAKACGGGNAFCDLLDTGPAADLSPVEIGWEVSGCPDLEGAGCDGPVVDCADIGACVACIDAVAVDQVNDLYNPPAPPAPGQEKCRAAIAKTSAVLFAARSAALQKCADAVLRRKVSGPCPDPGDGKAVAAITKAEAKHRRAVCDACGGADGACGGGDDPTPAEIGFPSSCPDVQVANGPACGGPVQSVDEVAICLACVTAFKADCADRSSIPNLRGYAAECNSSAGGTPTPTPTATPGGGGATCGNGVQEAGEDCDDHNTQGCDACPADCRSRPVACAASSTRFSQTVRLSRPPANLSSALLCLGYPAGVVALPGTGAVTGRTSGFSGLVQVNDSNDAARVALVGSQSIAALNVTISFDACDGASPPSASDFACEVLSASNSGAPVDPSQVACTPVTP